MKISSSKTILLVLSIIMAISLVSCFKPYDIEKTIEINPTIKQTRDFLKVDKAVKETTTVELSTETLAETLIEDLIETLTETDATKTTETNTDTTEEIETSKETKKESTEETKETKETKIEETNTNSIASIGQKTFVPTAPNTPAPDKNPNILKSELTTMVENKGWTYGKSPVSWIYVRPNTKIVSNYRPNGSAKYQITLDATSGEYGCYLPIFSGTNNVDEYYEGRFYCFNDYSKATPDAFRWTNGLEDFKIEGIKILDILKYKYPEMLEIKKGLYLNGEEYINIVYVKDIYDILNNK